LNLIPNSRLLFRGFESSARLTAKVAGSRDRLAGVIEFSGVDDGSTSVELNPDVLPFHRTGQLLAFLFEHKISGFRCPRLFPPVRSRCLRYLLQTL
jgi:hypothetical protein